MASDQAESRAAQLKEAIENIRKDFFKINESIVNYLYNIINFLSIRLIFSFVVFYSQSFHVFFFTVT